MEFGESRRNCSESAPALLIRLLLIDFLLTNEKSQPFRQVGFHRI